MANRNVNEEQTSKKARKVQSSSSSSDVKSMSTYIDPLTGWPGPRTVKLIRNDHGFGFTLRHFIVYPPESAIQAELRKSGDESSDTEGHKQKKRSRISALEPMDTIFVRQVKEGGPAEEAGLSTGDRIVSVNGESVTGKTYSQVVAHIQASDSTLTLLVVPKNEDILQMAYSGVAYNQSKKTHTGSASDIPSPPVDPYISPSEASSTSSLSTPVMARTPIDEPRDRSASDSKFKSVTQVQLMDASDISYGDMGIYRATPHRTNYQPNDIHLNHNSSPVGLDTYNDKVTNHFNHPPNVKSSSDSRLDRRLDELGRSTHDQRSEILVQRAVDSDSDTVSQRHRHRHSERRDTETGRMFAASAYFQKPTKVSEDVTRITQGNSNSPHTVHRTANDSLHPNGSNSPLTTSTHSSTTKQVESRPLDKSGRGRSASADMLTLPDKYGAYNHTDREDSRRGSSPVSPGDEILRYRRDIYGKEWDSDTCSDDRQISTYPLTNKGIHSTGQSNAGRRGDKVIVGVKTDVPGLSTGGMSMREYLTKQQTQRHDNLKKHNTPSVTSSSSSSGSTQKELPDTSQARTTEPNISRTEMLTSVSRSTEGTSWTRHPEQKLHRQNTDPDGCNLSNFRPVRLTDSRGYEIRRAEPVQVILVEDEDFDNMPPIKSSQNNPPSTLIPNANANHKLPSHMQSEHRPIIMHSNPGNNHSQHRGREGRSNSRQLPEKPNPHQIRSQSRDRHREPSPLRVRGREPSPLRDNRGREMTSRSQGSNPHIIPGATRHKSSQAKEDRKTHRSQKRVHISKECPPVPIRDSSRERMRERLQSGARLRARSEDRRSSRYNEFGNRSIFTAVEFTDDATSSSSGSAPGSRKSSVNTARPPSPDSACRTARRTSYLMATSSEDPVILGASMDVESYSPTVNMKTPNKRNPSIKKLKSFFGEGTPRIVEASEKSQDSASPSRLYDIAREGQLYCKVEAKDGKRASDRSWKPVYGVLKAHVLYLSKEKKDSPTSMEEHPISIKSAIVDIAYDYTKKKNVFRLCTYSGSEYLLQAPDTKAMLDWISVIQANNNPDADDAGVAREALIVRKTAQQENLLGVPNQPSNKHPLSPGSHRRKFTLRSASPGPHGRKPLKEHKEKDESTPKEGKSKPHNWKGKISRISKKFGPGSPVVDGNVNGTFNVVLEACPPSPNNEFVPYVVEVCCTIVESIGLDFTGIYRVPGNTSGVTHLQEECDKGMEDINLEDKKWKDVNVVGSLLKSFFRKLPEPIVPSDLYGLFIEANRKEEPTERMSELRRLVHQLPDHHFETLRFLAKHLKNIADNCHANKMEARNLAIVFGPTLVRPAEENMVIMVTDMSDQCRIVESIIMHCDWFFSSEDADKLEVPIDGSTEAAPSSNMDLLLLKVKEETRDPKERKHSRRTKKSIVTAPTTPDDEDFGFSERNIDYEISVRMKRQGMSHIKQSEAESTVNSETKQSEERIREVETHEKKIEVHERKSSSSSMKTGSQSSLEVKSTTESEGLGSSDQEASEKAKSYIRASKQAFQRNQYLPHKSSSTAMRKLSTESELSVISQKSNTSSNGKIEDLTIDRRKDKERIEKQYELALKDLENEDKLDNDDFALKVSAVSNEIVRLHSQDYEKEKHTKTEVSSVTSDYSTTTSSSTNFVTGDIKTPDTPGSRLDSDNFFSPDSDTESDLVTSMTETFDQRLKLLLSAENEPEKEAQLEHLLSPTEQTLPVNKHRRLRTSNTDPNLGQHLDAVTVKKTDSRSSLDDAALPDSAKLMHNDRPSQKEFKRGKSGENVRGRRPRPTTLANTGSIPTRSENEKEKSVVQQSTFSKARRKTQPVGSTSNSQLLTPTEQTVNKLVIESSTSPSERSPSPSKKVSRIEVVLTLQKKEGLSTAPVANTCGKTEVTTGNTKQQGFNQNEKELFRKKKEQKIDWNENRTASRRRHTLGGGKDLKDYETMLSVCVNGTHEKERKTSAFERLKPFGLESKQLENLTMKSWLRHQKSAGDLFTDCGSKKSADEIGLLSKHLGIAPKDNRTAIDNKRQVITSSEKRNISKSKTLDAHPQKLAAKPRFYDIESYL